MFKSYTQLVDNTQKKQIKMCLSKNLKRSYPYFQLFIHKKTFVKKINTFIKSHSMTYPHIHTTNSINTIFI